jgi:TPR repeat protein
MNRVAGVVLLALGIPGITLSQNPAHTHQAESGDATTQFRVGESYYYGKNGVQDFAQAAKWYEN